MYSKRSSLVIGFHGCDLGVRDKLVNSKTVFRQSKNDYDWLGHGMYFWENDVDRALEFASYKKERQKSITPSVLGATIDLGNCLDLLNSKNLQLIKLAYEILATELDNSGFRLPENTPLRDGKDLIFRRLDCAVIETLHENRKKSKLPEFDSVRGVFWEGEELYPSAGFREKNHIQICVRNPNCVKGFFIPRNQDDAFQGL